MGHGFWVGRARRPRPAALSRGSSRSLPVCAFITIWALARRGKLSVAAVSLGVLSVAVLAEKSFGPQYLVWLAPLWAYWPIRRGWLAVALLTTLVDPLLYGEAHAFGPGFFWATTAATVRNAVLVVATVSWFLGQLQMGRLNQQVVCEDPGAAHVESVLAVQPATR